MKNEALRPDFLTLHSIETVQSGGWNARRHGCHRRREV
jgi:hypothetical protein